MLTRLAPAKINLFLHVTGRFDDGYHELQTAYHLIDWCDEIEFELTSDGTISRGRAIEGVEEANDITVIAARKLRSRFPGSQGVIIRCKKHIPIGAGLGGGSSDAATTLLALNELWDLETELNQLAEIGLELGADVPVFIFGKNAWAEGKGEILSSVSISKQLYLVVFPGFSVSTARIFEAFHGTSYTEKIAYEPFFTGNMVNDLEEITCTLYPEVRTLIDFLKNWGLTRMTGSGSAAFIPIQSRELGESIIAELPTTWVGRVCLGQSS